MVSLILFEEKSVIYVDNLEIDSGYIDKYMIGHSHTNWDHDMDEYIFIYLDPEFTTAFFG